jgi:hypothetical protein
MQAGRQAARRQTGRQDRALPIRPRGDWGKVCLSDHRKGTKCAAVVKVPTTLHYKESNSQKSD